MSEPILIREDRGPVVVLTLNRPDRRNALSRGLVAALGDEFDRLATATGVRSVILTGAGPTFCAGMDLKEASATGPSVESEKQAVDDTRAVADLIDQIHRLPRPTIAALNGDALARGAGLALACDFVVAASNARIGYPEVRRGLVAAIVLHDLARQVGERRARQLVLTGEPISAESAYAWGLINEVTQPDRCLQRAIELAHSLIGCAPSALTTTKQQLDDVTRRPPDLRGAAAISAAVRVSEEAAEGMRAFLERRPPSWVAGIETGQGRENPR